MSPKQPTEIPHADSEKTNAKEKTANIKYRCPKWVCWVWLIAIVSIGLSIASFVGTYHDNITWSIENVSLAIILSFVGMLATFVVVNNYAQVKNIEDKFETKIHEVKEINKEFTNKAADKLKHLTMIYSSMNMAKMYEETGNYTESLYWYFVALQCAISGNFKDDQTTITILIAQMAADREDIFIYLSAVLRETYIEQLRKITTYSGKESAQKIIEVLKQPKSEKKSAASLTPDNSNDAPQQ